MNTIHFICPFHRPTDKDNVLRNFRRVNYPKKKLVIVENGPGLHSFQREECDLLLSSDAHQSWAKNEALDWIRRHGGGIWSTFDSDDYYGPSYGYQVAQGATAGRQLWGHGSWFIHNVGRGKFWLFGHTETPTGQRDGAENADCKYLHGATISGWAETTPDFRDTGRHGEDMDLIRRVDSRWAVSKYHYLWTRGDPANHTFDLPCDHIANLSLYGLKEYPEDYNIINGISPLDYYDGKIVRNGYTRALRLNAATDPATA